MNSWKLPLRLKLVVFCTLISCGALLVANFVTVMSSITSSRTMLQESLEIQARVLSDSLLSDLLFEDSASAKSSLEAMAVHTEIEVAAVYGRVGYLFCSYARPGMEDRVPKVHPSMGTTFGSHHVAVVAPIVDERGRMGTIYLRMGLRQMWQQIWNSIWVTVAVTVGVILIYYLMVSGAVTLARSGVADVAYVVWLPNLLLGAAGIWMLVRAGQERWLYPPLLVLAARIMRRSQDTH